MVAPTRIVAADIGGTHARFALAEIADGRVRAITAPQVFRTGEHASLSAAWQAYAAALGEPLPRGAGIAVAAPVDGETITLTNSHWVIRRGTLAEELGLDHLVLLNDFGAVGHAVAQAGPDAFRHVCGPEQPLPDEGVIGIVGPGTGLGVAQVLRRKHGYSVIETEGGHLDFAPLDATEDALLHHLRARFGRVSVERIVSGPGLANIHAALGAIEGRTVQPRDQADLWAAALDGSDTYAAAALDRFFLSLGSFAGDIALAQGAEAVVIAGGLGPRIADRLLCSGFAGRFAAKGRFQQRMAALPVQLITLDQPGLHGAAAAFAASA